MGTRRYAVGVVLAGVVLSGGTGVAYAEEVETITVPRGTSVKDALADKGYTLNDDGSISVSSSGGSKSNSGSSRDSSDNSSSSSGSSREGSSDGGSSSGSSSKSGAGEFTSGSKKVIAMGDSNLWSMRDKRMGDKGFESQLEKAGFDVVLDSSPGRSMKEEVKGSDPDGNYRNITDSIDKVKKENDGEDAIWVMAEGVNDSANVRAGSKYSNEERIRGVMDKLDGVSVVWPTVAIGDGAPTHYDKQGAEGFNKALRKVAKDHPNLVVMDWDKAVNPDWFLDGVHYKPDGYSAYIDLLKAQLEVMQGKLDSSDVKNSELITAHDFSDVELAGGDQSANKPQRSAKGNKSASNSENSENSEADSDETQSQDDGDSKGDALDGSRSEDR